MKRLILDIDGTLTERGTGDYLNVLPNRGVVESLHRYRDRGFEIVLHTSRNMRTYRSNTGKINANMLPVLFTWLEKHEIPYDEVWTGKPWCGEEGFYVDDKAIRPDEFATLSYDEIVELIDIGQDTSSKTSKEG